MPVDDEAQPRSHQVFTIPGGLVLAAANAPSKNQDAFPILLSCAFFLLMNLP
jgi:hypothetical protein